MSNQLQNILCSAARNELAESIHKIEHCVSQLTDAQLWWRPHREMNSIANLMLHLAGNIRQYLITSLTGEPDRRNRPMEFADHSNRPASEILEKLKSAVAEADAILARLTGEDLVKPIKIQGFDLSATSAIFHCLSHFKGHAQEIIHMTRQQLGDAYRFDYVPKTPEQISEFGPAI